MLSVVRRVFYGGVCWLGLWYDNDMQILFLVMMFLVGAALGSFLCCQAWRLKLSQKKTKKDWLGKRSVCLSCHKQLKWYDNIPIISWVLLRGKCRFCKKKIGASEIVAELLVGIIFLAFGIVFINNGFLNNTAVGGMGNISILSWVTFAVFLVLSLILIFLSIYDGKWGELPTIFLWIAILLAVAFWVLVGFLYGFSMEYVWQTVGALAILAGLYEFLYLLSKGRWIGDGDPMLCVALALGLGNVWLALFVLFMANMLGCLFYALKSIGKEKSKNKMIYFGPFLVAAFFFALIFRTWFLSLIQF